MGEWRASIFSAVADMLGALLVVVLVLFAVAFANIHTKDAHGNVTLRTQLLATMTWENGSSTDLDLWGRGPVGSVVGYPSKDNGYMHLDRDDLGTSSDTITVNGQRVAVSQRVENISVAKLLPGEYVFNVHYYSGSVPVEHPVLTVVQLSPYREVFRGSVPVSFWQEVTFVSFVVQQDGTITDVRTDVQIPLRSSVQ